MLLEFELSLNDGTLYKITCSRDDIDKLIDLIGESAIKDVEEL